MLSCATVKETNVNLFCGFVVSQSQVEVLVNNHQMAQKIQLQSAGDRTQKCCSFEQNGILAMNKINLGVVAVNCWTGC